MAATLVLAAWEPEIAPLRRLARAVAPERLALGHGGRRRGRRGRRRRRRDRRGPSGAGDLRGHGRRLSARTRDRGDRDGRGRERAVPGVDRGAARRRLPARAARDARRRRRPRSAPRWRRAARAGGPSRCSASPARSRSPARPRSAATSRTRPARRSRTWRRSRSRAPRPPPASMPSPPCSASRTASARAATRNGAPTTPPRHARPAVSSGSSASEPESIRRLRRPVDRDRGRQQAGGARAREQHVDRALRVVRHRGRIVVRVKVQIMVDKRLVRQGFIAAIFGRRSRR